MIMRMMVAGCMLAIACVAAAAMPAPARVSFPSLDRGDASAPIMISALYFRPAAAKDGAKIPAVIALHGCGGMLSPRAGRQDQLSSGMAARAQMLLDEGYAVLFPDSFNSRGMRQVCTIPNGERTITASNRRLDALGALAWLATSRGVDPTRIAVVGWSHGGSTALAAINLRNPQVAAFRVSPGAPPFFRAAVAFYPGCAGPLRAGERWQPGAPTRILIGELDDWTPATPCVDLANAMRVRGDDLRVTVYPNSHHAFDSPGDRIVLRTDVPNGVHPGSGVHAGANPDARAAANDQVRAFLRELLKSS
jgi:dienelactone hydrolase